MLWRLLVFLGAVGGAPVRFSVPVKTEGGWRYVQFGAEEQPAEVGARFCAGLGIENDGLRATCAASVAAAVVRRQDRDGSVVVRYPPAYGDDEQLAAWRARLARKEVAAPFALGAAGRAQLRRLCAVPFTQRAVRLGRLRRRAADRGALSFGAPPGAPDAGAADSPPPGPSFAAPVVPLLVLFRLHPRQVGGSAAAADVEGVLDVGVAATVGLGDALAALPPAQRAATRVVMALNGFGDGRLGGGGREGWARWAKQALAGGVAAPAAAAAAAAAAPAAAAAGGDAPTCGAPGGDGGDGDGDGDGAAECAGAPAAVEVVHCPAGNVASHACLTELLFNGSLSSPSPPSSPSSAAAAADDDDPVVLLLEDDYLLQPSALAELLGVFASHRPCFAAPYDGADRYTTSFNEDDGAVTVVAGQHRHWRTVRALSVTYAARLGTMRLLRPLLPHPLDDYDNSQRLAAALGGGAILTPLPGLASHIENIGHFSEPYVALYHDYVSLGQRLHERGAALPAFPGYAPGAGS